MRRKSSKINWRTFPNVKVLKKRKMNMRQNMEYPSVSVVLLYSYISNVQDLCEFKGLFLNIECRWPGRVHDSKLFENSSVSMKIRNGTLHETFQALVSGLQKIPNYLIGDLAYHLTPYSLKEYGHCSNNEQVLFNNILRSARTLSNVPLIDW